MNHGVVLHGVVDAPAELDSRSDWDDRRKASGWRVRIIVVVDIVALDQRTGRARLMS